MTSVPNGLSFLQSVAGYAQQLAVADIPSANAPIRLAVIDPSYVVNSYPGTLPRVTFEGEETVTDKRYTVVGNYLPVAGHRVVMLPVGHTYVILGEVNHTILNKPLGQLGYAEITSDSNGVTSTSATDLTGLSVPVTVLSNRRIKITFDGEYEGEVGAIGEIFIRESSTTLRKRRSGWPSFAARSPWHFHHVFTPSAGSHTYKISMARQTGTVTHKLIADSGTDYGPSSILVEDIGPVTA